MAFTLRSGNKTPFKKMGEKKETIDQYNARVKAEYDSNMQSYNDSTASYKNQVEIDNILTNIENEMDANPAFDEQTMVRQENQIDKAGELTFENEARGVYEPKRLQSGSQFNRGVRNPDDLRPKVLPKEPGYLIKTKGLELMPIENNLAEPKVEKSKRKYITSKDSKTKTNLETGEVTKVKKQKVKRKTRPGKRKVKNLVTGKNNKIQ